VTGLLTVGFGLGLGVGLGLGAGFGFTGFVGLGVALGELGLSIIFHPTTLNLQV
jgi:hypothetical protein